MAWRTIGSVRPSAELSIWNPPLRHSLNEGRNNAKGENDEREKEAGDFADKKREEQGRGVIVAGPDAHEKREEWQDAC